MCAGFKGASEMLNSVQSQNPRGLEGTSGDLPAQAPSKAGSPGAGDTGMHLGGSGMSVETPQSSLDRVPVLGHPPWKEVLSHGKVEFFVV